jgi:hypothetical protein
MCCYPARYRSVASARLREARLPAKVTPSTDVTLRLKDCGASTGRSGGGYVVVCPRADRAPERSVDTSQCAVLTLRTCRPKRMIGRT